MTFINRIPVLVRIPLKFGFVSALLSIILMWTLYSFGRHPNLLPLYFDSRIILLLIFIYFAIREYKEYHNNGMLHYWEGMALGIMTYVVMGLLGALFILVYDNFDASFVTSYVTGAREGAEKFRDELINGAQPVKMSEEEFNRHMVALSNTTAWVLAKDYFIKTCFLGLFMPFVYSAFFRKVNA